MIRYLLLFVFVLFSSIASAQDLIVTNKNDSIKCKIERDDFEFVYYAIKLADSSISTKIKLTEVRNIRYNYFANKSVNTPEPIIRTLVYYPIRTYRAYVNAGVSYVTAKTLSTDDKVLDKHLDELKLGYHYELGLNYYGDKKIGFGIKHSHFESENKINEYLYVDTVLGDKVGERSNRIRTNYYALSFESRTSFFNNNMELLLGVAAGYVHYRNDAMLLSPMKITGGTIGIQYEFGVDYRITRKIAVGIDIHLLQATMRKYTYEINGTSITRKLDSDKYENISRIDVSGGLRYYINR